MTRSSLSNMTAVASNSRPRYAAQYDSTVEICVWGNIACHRCGTAMIVASSAPGDLARRAIPIHAACTCGPAVRVPPAGLPKPLSGRDAPRLQDVLLERCELLAQGFDVLLVKADRLSQLGEPIGVFLSVLLLLGQRRGRSVAIGRASLDQ